MPKLAKKGTSYVVDAGKSDAEILSCLNSIYSGIPVPTTEVQISTSRRLRIEGLSDLMSRSQHSSGSSNGTATTGSPRVHSGFLNCSAPVRSLSDDLQRLRSRRASMGNAEISKLARAVEIDNSEPFDNALDDRQNETTGTTSSGTNSIRIQDAEPLRATQTREPVSRRSLRFVLSPQNESCPPLNTDESVSTQDSCSHSRLSTRDLNPQQTKSWLKQAQAFYKDRVKR